MDTTWWKGILGGVIAGVLVMLIYDRIQKAKRAPSTTGPAGATTPGASNMFRNFMQIGTTPPDGSVIGGVGGSSSASAGGCGCSS